MGKLYRDEVSGVVTDEYGNPVNANQSFGSNPDSTQGAAVNGGLLSYLMGKGREAISNPEAPWNAQSGLLAVADTAALPAKAIGQGLLALPDRIQNVTGAAQRGDYGPATDDAMSVAFSGLPVGAATAPAGVAGMFAGKSPWLTAAIRHDGKLYKAPEGSITHIEALDAIPPDIRAKAQWDSNNRVFVTPTGRVLDRFRAQDYAIKNDLISYDAPQYARTSPELVSEFLASKKEISRRGGDSFNQDDESLLRELGVSAGGGK